MARWSYAGGRWLLIGLGVYLVGSLAVIEIRERRAGLGTGVAVAVVLAGIKGVLTAASRSSRHSNP